MHGEDGMEANAELKVVWERLCIIEQAGGENRAKSGPAGAGALSHIQIVFFFFPCMAEYDQTECLLQFLTRDCCELSSALATGTFCSSIIYIRKM